MEIRDSLVLALVSKKAIDLYKDIQQYATIFWITSILTIKDAAKALQAFKKAA